MSAIFGIIILTTFVYTKDGQSIL